MERVEIELSFVEFRPSKLHIPINRLGSTEGFPFEFELGSRLV
jgi:hypothetical protein